MVGAEVALSQDDNLVGMREARNVARRFETRQSEIGKSTLGSRRRVSRLQDLGLLAFVDARGVDQFASQTAEVEPPDDIVPRRPWLSRDDRRGAVAIAIPL